MPYESTRGVRGRTKYQNARYGQTKATDKVTEHRITFSTEPGRSGHVTFACYRRHDHGRSEHTGTALFVL